MIYGAGRRKLEESMGLIDLLKVGLK